MKIISEAGDKENEEASYNHREFSSGSFSKTFVIPRTVNTEGIRADYQNGILLVVLPKNEEYITRPPRTIDID